jgi:hypothetical protein
MTRSRGIQLLSGLYGLALFSSATLQAQTLEWMSVLSITGSEHEFGFGVSADGLGNAYLTGHTYYRPVAGFGRYQDAFVSKFDAAGNSQWTSEFGASSQDIPFGVSADRLGNIYMAGEYGGDLPNNSGSDAFLTKHDSAGNLLWSQLLDSGNDERARSVWADEFGNAYIAGSTAGNLSGMNAGPYDAFVVKYDPSGNTLWRRQIGSTQDDGFHSISADGLGSVYVSGGTRGDLGGRNAGDNDAFVTKYDDAGSLLWTRQLGTANDDRARGVAADGLGNVYVAGFTSGSLGGPNAGKYDVFLTKYDPSGNLHWVRQLGTTFDDGCCAGGSMGAGSTIRIAADGLGNVYLASFTLGRLSGAGASSIYEDAFVAKYDAAGNLQWIEQFGMTGAREVATGVLADGLGNIYISGSTECHSSNPGANCALEGAHAFVAKFRDKSIMLSGDFNIDGTVNAADYVVWRNGLGTTYTQDDYDVWRAHFGETAGSLGATAGLPSSANPAVPEPTSAARALFAMSLLVFLHRAHHAGLPAWNPVWKPESAINQASRHRPARLGGAVFDCRRAKHRSTQTSCEGTRSNVWRPFLVCKHRPTEQAPVVPSRIHPSWPKIIDEKFISIC